MSKVRNKSNQGLPLRWREINGTYYYRVPPGLEHLWDGKQQFRLGDSLQEASQVWSQRLAKDGGDTVSTIGQLLDRYQRETIPAKTPASQASNLNQLPKLREVFGAMPLLPFKPQLIYQYVDQRSKKKTNPITGKVTGGKIAAHREVELLSHAYTKAVEWGYIDRHPFKGEVRLTGEKPRERYVEDWEILEALTLKPRRAGDSIPVIQAYIRIKLLTGMAQGDLLRLTTDNLKEDGIHNQRHKTINSTGKRTIYLWSPELKEAVEMAQAVRPKQSTLLFCTRRGEPYINELIGRASGWKSIWQRYMARIIAETKVTQTFTEHDLRAKVGSDADSLEHARALLSHTDSRTTDKIYRRKAEKVSTMRKAA